MELRIAAVDLVSNTCFPALAADELGFFKAEGLDVRIELAAMLGATKALRAGQADAMIAGSVHDVLTEFPDWDGVKNAFLKVLGAEGTGVPEQIAALAERHARVPMRARVESLNVGVAGAILVYEAARQRGTIS